MQCFFILNKLGQMSRLLEGNLSGGFGVFVAKVLPLGWFYYCGLGLSGHAYDEVMSSKGLICWGILSLR